MWQFERDVLVSAVRAALSNSMYWIVAKYMIQPREKCLMELFSKLLSHVRVGGSLHIVALVPSSE